MIRIRRSAERGHADHGWLDTYHTFSFADYFDPEFTQFGVLRVLNQDFVQAGQGFPTHGHHDMEIVTYVLEGVLEHRDSMGNGSQIRPGEVQFMSAGTGVTHSEFNASDRDVLHLLQMWVLPARRGFTPRYEQKDFGEQRQDRLLEVVTPDGRDGTLTIGQDASLHVSALSSGQAVRHEFAPGRDGWLHVARGEVDLDGERLAAGDGVAITGARSIAIAGVEDADLVLWDLPAAGGARA